MILDIKTWKYYLFISFIGVVNCSWIFRWRKRYLAQIHSYRQKNGFIIYYDETWTFPGKTGKRSWHMPSVNMWDSASSSGPRFVPGPRKGSGKGCRLIVLSLLCEEGIVPNSAKVLVSGNKEDAQLLDFHSEVTGATYRRYLESLVPDMIKAAGGRPVVLIIDNASIHGELVEKVSLEKIKNILKLSLLWRNN